MDLRFYAIRVRNLLHISFAGGKSPDWARRELKNLGFQLDKRTMSWRGAQNHDKALAIARQACEGGHKKRQTPRPNRNETLCWSCAKSGYGNASECPWEREFKPVDGWKAIKETKRQTYGIYGKQSESYTVIKCPLFQLDPRVKEKGVSL